MRFPYPYPPCRHACRSWYQGSVHDLGELELTCTRGRSPGPLWLRPFSFWFQQTPRWKDFRSTILEIAIEMTESSSTFLRDERQGTESGIFVSTFPFDFRDRLRFAQ